jgi:threonine synthase
VVTELWRKVDREGGFDLAATLELQHLPRFGFVSGSSTHADRLETIRRVYRDTGRMIDTHTADGLKVGLEHREAGVPLVCLETALPIKFAATIREALGREPEAPSGFEDLESHPQRVEVMDPDADAVKRFIVQNCEESA